MTIFWINTAIILCTIPSLVQGHGYLIDRDLIEKKDGFKFNFHSGSGIVRNKGFRSLGCWKDTWTRAIEVLEKRHELLMDKNYKLREDPLRKCAIAALDKKMKLFAIENGGQCLGGVSITSSYKKYGEAHHCKEDGYGGPWSMQVYGFTGRRRHDGGYSEWSRWTECSEACGKGTRRRFRTCTHPSPTLGGRDCIRLGLGMETKTCETECLGTENDELENPSKMRNSLANHEPHESDDNDDYFDGNDDDDVDGDDIDNEDDDNHDKTTSNSEDEPDQSSVGKNGNKSDENDDETRLSHEITDLPREEKNTNAQLHKPAVKMFEDQVKAIDGNHDSKISLSSPTITEESIDKTKSLSQEPLDIELGSNNKNNDLGDGGSNDDESGQDNRLSLSPQTNSAVTGDAIKKPVSGLSQGTTDIQPAGSTNKNNDHSNGVSDGDKFGQQNGVSPLPKTSSTSSGVGDKIKQFSSSENKVDKTHQNGNNDEDDAMENNLSDMSSTQASDADMKEPGHNTADIESDDPEVNTVQSTSDARIADKEISGNVPNEKESNQDNDKDIVDEDTNDTTLSAVKSTMEGEASNKETFSNSPNVQEPSESSDDTDTDNIVEKPDDNASDSQSNEDKSVKNNEALNSVNSDDEASMKEQSLAAGNSHTGSATTANDEMFRGKNNLPNKQQMKAAQDLLRSRWLSLAKSGRLKSPPTMHSDVQTFKSSKPVVDVSLKDDNAEDFEDQEMEDDDESEVDDEEVKEWKINGEEVHGQAANAWKVEEQDKKPKETQMDDKIDEKTTEGHTQEEQNENTQTNDKDNKATYGGQMEEDTTDDQKTSNDSAGDHTMNASDIDQHEEPLSEHNNNEMEEVEGQVNGIVMNEKIPQEDGAKRVKEECICPKLNLMGKPGPNVKPCPCMLQPSKKTDAEKNDKANTEMTKEEYKSGMFHASGLPKEDTLSETSPQPLSISKIPGATLTSTSRASPQKKPITAMSKTKPSGGSSPAHATMPVKAGASLSAPEKTSQTSQNISGSSQPATQSKPVTVGATQATPANASEKIIHIKHDKLKPLSRTLSALGESLNQAHDKGELEEGKYALDSDIHNLLKTIGKLKSQVDNLRNDQIQLGNNDMLGSSQVGGASDLPSQTQDTGKSNNQSSPSIPPTDQSQSSSSNESGPSKGLGSKSESGGQIPLKLRIVDKIANKQQKNATTLHLELSDRTNQVQNVGKPLFQSPSLGTIKGNSNISQDTPAQSTISVPSTDNIGTGANSLNSTVFVANKATPKPKHPLPTKVAQQTMLLPSEDNKVIQTASLTQRQSNTASKQLQQNTGKTGVNGDAQNTKPSNVAADNMLKTPQSSVKSQNLTKAQTDAKQTTNAKPNPPLTTTPKIVKTPASQLATNGATAGTLQDANPTKPNHQTSTQPQQTVIQTVKPIASKLTTNEKPPQSNTQLPTENTVASQKPPPSKPSSQSVVTNGQAPQPQFNTITQQSLHENTIENAAWQLASTNTGTTAGNQRQRPTQKTKDFAAIESQLAKIVETQQATEKSTIPDCNINLGFVLDGSASVEGTRRGNFLKMINFVKDMIHGFVVLSNQVHVGTLVYSTNSSVILSFGTKGTEKIIDQILDSIHYPGQGSLTGKAIKDSWNQMFSSVPRGRKSKLVLLTDGPSNDDVKAPAKWIRDNGVEMFVIGLGKGYDETQLRDMASLPSDKHIMYKDYDGLSASVQEVRNKVCGFSPKEVLQIITSARMSDNLEEINAFQRSFGPNQCILDVVFLLDGSRQVETNGLGNFQREINFVKKAASYLPLSRNHVHIGVGLLGDSNVMVFPMNAHYTQNSLAYELDHIRYPASSDIQPQEIQYARQIMLMKGVRDVAPRVFVLVTDVSSLDSYRRAINELRTDGSDVAMFGVGTDVYKQEVKVRPSVPGLVDQIVTLDDGDETEAAKRFATNVCKLSSSKRAEIPRLHWKASDKILNKN